MGVEITGSIKPVYARDTGMRDAGHGRRDVAQAKATAERGETQRSDLQSNLEILRKTYAAFNKRLSFYLNEEIDRVVVKVIDGETDKVIKEIPPEEIQDLVARIQKAIGVLVDEMI